MMTEYNKQAIHNSPLGVGSFSPLERGWGEVNLPCGQSPINNPTDEVIATQGTML